MQNRANIRTDLAMEARELHGHLAGMREETEQAGEITVTRIHIELESTAKILEKPVGHYVTIDAPELMLRDTAVFRDAAECLRRELERLIDPYRPERGVLVVGLGNRYITPDALGPRVVEKTFVTRHIAQYMPETVSRPVCPVAAMAPGVLGITGVETVEVLKGLVEHIKPAFVIAIDALASRRAARISSTIQLCDTGVSPGSGVGNMRLGINEETLGVPVIAIGVPTVVYASTITRDVVSLIAEEVQLPGGEEHIGTLIDRVVQEEYGPMVVTPKDIDTVIGDMAGIIANAINRLLHKAYYEEIEELLA